MQEQLVRNMRDRVAYKDMVLISSISSSHQNALSMDEAVVWEAWEGGGEVSEELVQVPLSAISFTTVRGPAKTTTNHQLYQHPLYSTM